MKTRTAKIFLDDYGSFLGRGEGCLIVRDRKGKVEKYPLFENEIGEVHIRIGNSVSSASLALPSLEDIVFIIILLVPGFFAFMLFKKIGIRERQVSEFESTIWSLFASLAIYAVFGYFAGFFNLDLIRENILNPVNIASIFGLAIVLGGSSGLVVRLLFRRGYQAGDCWEACVKAAGKKGSHVLVYASNNEEYKGELIAGGVSEAAREIVIKNPKLIVRDSDLSVKTQFEIGKTMVFKETDIRRIVFLKDVFDKTDS